MSLQFDSPISPAEILREEYLVPLGMSPGALARKLHVPRTRIERLVRGVHPVTSDTALRLAKYFNTTPEFWMAMQTSYDLAVARQSIAAELDAIDTMAAA